MPMRHRLLRIGITSVAGILIIVGLILVERRLPDWKSDDTLWPAALRVDPRDPQANYNLALSAGRRGDWGNARRSIEIAARGNPGSARIAAAHAWVLLQTNDITGAVGAARCATALAPYQPDGWYYLALGLHQAGDHAGELAAIDELLKISPDFPRARETRKIAACEAECEAPGKCDCLRGR
jgi:tetratricopeptide (TPR) repeat protein